MSVNTGTLHIVTSESEQGLLTARVVELKIAVTGRDQGEIIEEVARAIRCHYEFAISRGLTPFATLFQDTIELRGLVPTGAAQTIELPPEVAMALATALHAPTPGTLHIQSVRTAA